MQRLAVLRKANNTLGKGDHVLHVGFRNFLTHAVLGGINDALRDTLVIILHEGSDVMLVLVGQVGFVLHEQSDLCVALVVRHDLDKFGEMPRVPFPDAHRESVDCLVQLIENSNSLDDMVVVTLHRELNFRARISVTKTKLGSGHVSLAQLLQQLRGMQSQPTKHVLDNFAGVSRFAFNKREGRFDTSSKRLISESQNHLVLLVRLRQV